MPAPKVPDFRHGVWQSATIARLCLAQTGSSSGQRCSAACWNEVLPKAARRTAVHSWVSESRRRRATPRYVRQYADAFDEIGHRAFRERCTSPALVGIGLFGSITTTANNRRTHELDADSDLAAMQALLDRVWFLKKRPHERSPWITVGQDHDNDLVIAEYSLSSRHCAFAKGDDRIAVADLASLNGTKIDDHDLPAREPWLISDGQKVTLGRLQLLFFTAEGFYRHVGGLSQTGLPLEQTDATFDPRRRRRRSLGGIPVLPRSRRGHQTRRLR